MKLIKNGTVINPDWVFNDQAKAIDRRFKQIVPVELFLNNTKLSSGIAINVDTNLDDIAPHFEQISLIVIEFEAYADGRGFSIAHRLRHNLRYQGEIWGVGSLIVDQYAMAVQCGIDAVLVDEHLLQRQPIEHWHQALVTAPQPYRFHGDLTPDRKLPRLQTPIESETIEALNVKFKDRPTRELLEFVLGNTDFGNLALVSSFGAESAVLLHMVAEVSPLIPVLFLDTGKLFPETLEYQSQLTARLKLANVINLYPDGKAIEHQDPAGTLWQSNNEACCNLRKVNPLQNALIEYDTWINGRKSYQSELRSPLELFERSGGHIKINALAHWSHDQLAEYMQHHDLPAHPLVAQGYASIGCATCTTPVCDGEHARAGRWRGANKTECGIHFANGKTVREHQQSF